MYVHTIQICLIRNEHLFITSLFTTIGIHCLITVTTDCYLFLYKFNIIVELLLIIKNIIRLLLVRMFS